jgi:predicted kinase
MIKLLILQGLPASGKTTYAKELVDKKGYKRINKDDLRLMIDNSFFSKKNEEAILDARDLLVDMYLRKGYSVVVDDTNFEIKHTLRLEEIAYCAELATNRKIDIESKFIDTPVYECIERDSKRDGQVGKKVILDMYNKYLYKPKEFNIDRKKDQCVIIDVDGTLAYKGDRGYFDYNLVSLDIPNIKLIEIINLLPKNVKRIIVSGRIDECKDVTEEWLRYNGVYYDEIYMRKTGDNRCDTFVKKEIYEENIKNRYEVLAVYDDRPKVIRMWKEQGLFVMDCNTEDPRIDF